ncbi:hypothetical protein QNI19_12975 [Cytophagaceae bacterium DM2B3-1]|uniref:Uncharacterized protein n=1 Tax=Xanthocytophaga flava TaxID=3048013 RepID=A0ABT7CJC6_9BACT|nr:hypothetical protein [Xanthocytophaga flavus]MDJ1493848.1 hypothetical protein [Xanthocytophaga flavus]
MNTKLVLAGICTFICVFSNGQTKLIAHKSHSGSSETFGTALKNDFFDLESSNFGLRRVDLHKNILDTVVFVSDTVTVLVYRDKISNSGKPSKKPSIHRDTLNNHPIVVKKHPKYIIKDFLRGEYGFQNSLDSVPFIEYKKTDASPSQNKKKEGSLYILPQNTNQPPFDSSKLLLVGLVGVFAVLAAFISLKWKQLRFWN